MEILSWNISSGGFKDYGSEEKKPERIEGISKGVRALQPDVAGLIDTYRWTEVFTSQELGEIFGYPDVLAVQLEDERLLLKGHDNGIAVMAKLPHIRLDKVRMATRNVIRTRTPEIDIFTVYLDDVSEETRLRQTRVILGMVDPTRPTIITGDLNTIDRGDLEEADRRIKELTVQYPGPMKTMEASLNEMRRGEVTALLAESGFVDLGKGRGNTVPAKLFPLPCSGPILRLDYAFGNELIRLADFRVLTDGVYANLSDHYPIWMRVGTS